MTAVAPPTKTAKKPKPKRTRVVPPKDEVHRPPDDSENKDGTDFIRAMEEGRKRPVCIWCDYIG